jgi:AcrR family transcriptional regulator
VISPREPRTAHSRQERNRTRSRAALIAAACEFLASPIGAEASIHQITNRADVGVGTFYNHFENKSELFEAAIVETLDRFGAFFDDATAGIDDPALLYANGIRMTVLLRRSHRQMTDIVMRLGWRSLMNDRALVPRALRGLHAAADAGRLQINDFETAIACTAGSLLGCLQLLAADPNADVEAVATELATNLLRMFGLPESEARALATAPLPLPAPAPRPANPA